MCETPKTPKTRECRRLFPKIAQVWGAEVPKSPPPMFEGPLNHGRFVHNSAPPYHNLFRPLRYHPGAARSALKPVETASGC